MYNFSLRRWLFALGLVALGVPSVARADALDRELLKQSPVIMGKLAQRNKNYKNIAVLPFKVEKGTRSASYHGGPIATGITTRLENCLIMTQKVKAGETPIGIIRDAAGVASAAKVKGYTSSTTQRMRLFNLTYPLAWGNARVKPDVFITGVISNMTNRRKTTVYIKCFDKNSQVIGGVVQLHTLCSFTFDTDRAMFRDLGYHYALNRRALARNVTPKKRDEIAADQIEKQEKGQQPAQGGQGAQAEAHDTDNIAGFKFEIYYDGKKQTIRKLAEQGSQAKSGLYQVDPVPDGTKKVEFRLTRNTDEEKTLGVVVKVNGKSTFQEEEVDSLQCRKWLYAKKWTGKTDVFEGFYATGSDKNVKKFIVLSPTELKEREKELGQRVGWIDVDVFGPGEDKNSGDEPKMISSRGLSSRSLAKKPKTFKALQEAMLKANKIKFKPRGPKDVVSRGPGNIILSELEPSGSAEVQESEGIPNPVRLGGVSIKYFDKSDEKMISE